MRRTPFSQVNSNFSNRAHAAAQRLVYPQMFGTSPENLSFESTLLETNERGRVLDGEMAIDRIVKVTARQQSHVAPLRQPIIFTVQERFRRIKFARYKDLTITEWNKASNLPSELYKLTANFFVYGYFDDRRETFVDVITTAIPTMLIKLCAGRLSYMRRPNPRSNQDFITVTFADLERCKCVIYRQVRAT